MVPRKKLRPVRVPQEFDDFLIEKRDEKRAAIGVGRVSKSDIMRDIATLKNNIIYDRRRLKFTWGWK